MSVKLSVAMATYNGELYIEEQLNSILGQLPNNAEIIISDDGSTDGTSEIVKRYQKLDPRIRLFDGPKEGVIANFENAIKACEGDYIFLSDQDDLWMDGKVDTVMHEFGCIRNESGDFVQTSENNRIVLVVHDAVVVNQDLSQVIYPSFFEYRNCKAGFWANLWKNRFIGCCMTFHKTVKDTTIPIPHDIPMHDQWIGLVSEKQFGRSAFIKKQLLKYRRHDSNASDFNRNPIGVMIKNRIHLLKKIHKAKLGK